MIVTLRTRGGTLAKAKEGKDYKLLVSFFKKITETSLTLRVYVLLGPCTLVLKIILPNLLGQEENM